jgi:hypothetical protein
MTWEEYRTHPYHVRRMAVWRHLDQLRDRGYVRDVSEARQEFLEAMSEAVPCES